MDAYLQVSTTVGTRAEAAQLADRAVTESFAATAQVSGPVMIVDRNPYRDTQREAWQVTLRTTARRYNALESYLLAEHPDSDPEIWAVSLTGPAACLERLDRMTLP
ncbi:divalent cation tolerance protein CutA [Kribbella sp. NPDC023972]|uniref:divalent cation tolerance protein CutA n=1 Tax=Kribbella sp. NPDC023972 TaxID=3154795 RepID=UPI00340B81AA